MVYNVKEKTITMEWDIEIITPSFPYGPYGPYDNIFILDENAYMANVVAASHPDSPFSEITGISVSRPFASEDSYRICAYH